MTIASTEVDSYQVKRRTVLVAGGAAVSLVGLSLTACNQDSGEQSSDNNTPDPDRPQEAPLLTERVESGDLPPLEERLPVEGDRLVIEPAEFGQYGGTYNGVVLGAGDEAWITRLAAFETALRIDHETGEVGLPGILKEVEFNDEGTEYTLHLREGLRWSDGEPVTADDVLFAIEDVYLNDELWASPPGVVSANGEPCTAERIDDYTVQMVFPSRKGDLIGILSRSSGDGSNLFYYPKHYFEQFLPHLDDGAVDLADEAGFSDWTSYVSDLASYYNNPDKPVLNAWMVTSPLNQGNAAILERNPYYWVVDSEGAQLPFIDYMDFEIVQEDEVMLMKAVNGEIDFHQRHFVNDQNRPVLSDSMEDGDYHLISTEPTAMNRVVISLNLNHEDEVLREIFQNKDFRIGLSHAIDRQEIIDTTLQRQGEPWQAAPRPDSDYYDEEFAKQYTEYDVDLANEFLDSAGLTERDSDGFRLRPDGDRLRFNIDMVAGLEPHWAPGMDMVSNYWQEVGVDARVSTVERTLFYDRKTASACQHDANIWGGDGGLRTEVTDPRWYFPHNDESNFATRWANWYQTRGQGEHALEPPEETVRQMELMWELLAEPDADRQEEMFREVIQISKDQFYAIGIALPTEGYAIVKNSLRNVPDSYVNTHETPFAPEAWFFEN